MNSLDPWRTIVTDSWGDVILPRPYYGHPFYRGVPSWINYDNDPTRLLFDGVFIGGDPVVSGFFDNVKNAVLKYTGTSATNQFIKDKGLEPYVKMAATAVATAYGGPAAGAAAGALSGPVMSLGVKDKTKEAAAKRQIQQVSIAVQQQSPQLAPAVDVARDSIQKTATTYHVAQIMNDAKAGNPEAQRALDNLKQAAARGDVEAQQALQLANVIDREQSSGEASGTVSGWVDIIGANMTNIIGAELTALSAPGYALPGYGFPAYGYGYGPFRPYGGVFFGAEAPPPGVVVAPPPGTPPVAPIVVPVPPGGAVATADPGRTGLLAEIAPVVAPATGEIAVRKELDAKQVLHVELCVDGKCYRTSMDLAPAIELVMKKLSQWHDAAHAPPPQPTTVVQSVEKAIGAATDSMVGVMVGHHVAVMTSGWLSDIGGAIGGTLRKLQPVISTVATGVATAYGGPAAGAAAAKLAPMITNLQANALDPKGDPKRKAAAAAALQRVNAVAATNPTAAQALAAANQAVKNTTVAYHVKDTAERAAVGDTTAQTDISNLVQAAEAGDPAAKSTFEILSQTFAQEMMKSEAGAKLWEQITGRGPATVSSIPTTASGWYDIAVGQWHDVVGAALDDFREKARAHAVTKPGSAAGVLITVDGRLHGRGFRNLDDAIDWLQHITRERASFTYAAAYEKDSDGAAYIQAEEIGRTSQPAPTPTPIPREAPAMTAG